MTLPHSTELPYAPPVPIVCVGFSMGGMKPLKTIFERLKGTTGMAFVIVAHIRRNQPTGLPWLLSQWSTMPAQLISSGLFLLPNHIYVIPPGDEITVEGESFQVQLRSKLGWSNVVTLFLDSMGKRCHPAGIAVILSGMAADGAAALGEFQRCGGITIVQDLSTADQAAMPRAAIDTGAADHILPPEEMAAALEGIARDYNPAATVRLQ